LAARAYLQPIGESGSGNVQEKQRAQLRELIEKINDLFEGELTDGDRLNYVEGIKGKLLESDVLVQQAANNQKEQFAHSPDLPNEFHNAVISLFDAHGAMSKQVLNSADVRARLMHLLLNELGLWEALREKAKAG
jgi:type I restriction enzyme R subunit